MLLQQLVEDAVALILHLEDWGWATSYAHQIARLENTTEKEDTRLHQDGCGVKTVHPGGNPWENLESISHTCHPILVAFVLDLTRKTIDLPVGCLQGGGWDDLVEDAAVLILHLGERGWMTKSPGW